MPEEALETGGKDERVYRRVSVCWDTGEPLNANPYLTDLQILSQHVHISTFYRAMHYSAKRGPEITCRLSVYLSVCDVGGS